MSGQVRRCSSQYVWLTLFSIGLNKSTGTPNSGPSWDTEISISELSSDWPSWWGRARRWRRRWCLPGGWWGGWQRGGSTEVINCYVRPRSGHLTQLMGGYSHSPPDTFCSIQLLIAEGNPGKFSLKCLEPRNTLPHNLQISRHLALLMILIVKRPAAVWLTIEKWRINKPLM